MPLKPVSTLVQAADALWKSPARLACFVLAVNGVANLYAGITHDAIVYSLETLNAASGGAYADDLFLKYGSQDQFSIASKLLAPIVHVLGLNLGFACLYFASTILWLWAASRLIDDLFDEPGVKVLALLFVAVTPMWYGGLQIFHIAEPFFTPRLPACGLTLLAVSFILRHRLFSAFVALILAALLHPIMAVAGLCVWAGAVLTPRVPAWFVVAVVGATFLGVCALLLREVVTALGFPLLDDVWRDVIRRAAPCNFPDEWTVSDWTTIVGSMGIVGSATAVMWRQHRHRALVLAFAVLCAVAGVAITALSSRGSNALIFQAQSYRALWLLAFLEAPLGVWLALRGWREDSVAGLLTTTVIVWYLARPILPSAEIGLAFLIFLSQFLYLCATTNQSFQKSLIPALKTVTVSAIPISAAMPLLGAVAARHLLATVGPVSATRTLMSLQGPVFMAAIAAAGLLWLRRYRSITAWVAVGLAVLVLQVVQSVVPQTYYYRSRYDRDWPDVRFAERYLAARRKPAQELLTVYADFVGAPTVWIDWHEKSYFLLSQTVGVMFQRENALEVMRRASIVRRFELQRFARLEEPLTENLQRIVGRLFDQQAGLQPPTADDLHHLCSQPEVDIAMITGPSVERPAASNGHINIYECSDMRARPALPATHRDIDETTS